LKLHYSISGVGEPILLIHGAYVNSDIWHYQQVYFKKHFKVINVDLRGHGQTPASELPEYSVGTFGEDLVHLMDELHLKKTTIFGLSLGAMVAQYMAANYPSRVNGIVLVGATASLRLNLLERVVTTFIFPKWVAMKLFSRLETREFMKISFALTWFMLGNKWLGNNQTREKIRGAIIQVPREELKKIYNAIHSFRKQNLDSGDYPVLLINGENDSPVIHRHTRYLNKKIGARASQLEIKTAGHACNHDQPLIFNQLVFDWLVDNNLAQVNYSYEKTKETAISLGVG
jgi:pimeloyl-ACP methyl ester carboxylesterase